MTVAVRFPAWEEVDRGQPLSARAPVYPSFWACASGADPGNRREVMMTEPIAKAWTRNGDGRRASPVQQEIRTGKVPR